MHIAHKRDHHTFTNNFWLDFRTGQVAILDQQKIHVYKISPLVMVLLLLSDEGWEIASF